MTAFAMHSSPETSDALQGQVLRQHRSLEIKVGDWAYGGVTMM